MHQIDGLMGDFGRAHQNDFPITMLNAVQEQQAILDEQRMMIEKLQEMIAEQRAEIMALKKR